MSTNDLNEYSDFVYRVTLVRRAAQQNATLAQEAHMNLIQLVGKDSTVEVEKQRREFVTRASMHAVQAKAAAARATRELVKWSMLRFEEHVSVFDPKRIEQSRTLLTMVKEAEEAGERAMQIATRVLEIYGLHTYTEIDL